MKKLHPVSVGLTIRTAREAVQMSASDLAVEIGLSPSAMSRIENGIRGLEFQDAILIAEVLKLKVQDLMDRAQRLEDSGVIADHIAAVEKLKETLAGARQATQAAMNEVNRADGP